MVTKVIDNCGSGGQKGCRLSIDDDDDDDKWK